MNGNNSALTALARTTQDVYERNAERFDRERPKGLHERRWLDRLVEDLNEGDAILDVGCGAADPIAGYFLSRGLKVTGIDASHRMIDLAKKRWPDADWQVKDMRDLAHGPLFDAVLAWNSFFHLTMDEQRAVLPMLCARLVPSGRLMLTVGPRESEEVGRVGDDPIYHSSLSQAEYAQILTANHLRILSFVLEDPDCDMQTILLAEKAPAAPT